MSQESPYDTGHRESQLSGRRDVASQVYHVRQNRQHLQVEVCSLASTGTSISSLRARFFACGFSLRRGFETGFETLGASLGTLLLIKPRSPSVKEA